MMRLDDMLMFAKLAEMGSLSKTARTLGTTKQTVSRRLYELEQSLGVVLANRTTRTLTLTEIGRAYAARCAEIARLAEQANRSAAAHLGAVSGTLRVTADPTFGESFLPPLLTEFVQRHAAVSVEVFLTAQKVDLVKERFDVGFRIGAPPDVAHLASTRLGPAQLWTVASPAYVAAHGQPNALAELDAHDCLGLVPSLAHMAWPFAIEGTIRAVPVAMRLKVNGLEMARQAALAGAGIAQLPAFAVAEDVNSGRLVRLFESHTPEVGGVNLVYLHAQRKEPRVREFVTLARERFQAHALMPVELLGTGPDRAGE